MPDQQHQNIVLEEIANLRYGQPLTNFNSSGTFWDGVKAL